MFALGMRTPSVTLLLLAVLGAASACSASRPSEDRLLIAEAAATSFGLVSIAEAKGYFADEGLATEYLHFTAGRESLAAVIEGRADVGMAYQTPIARRSFETSAFRILTSLHRSHEDTRIIARADRGIRSSADLRGKRIGLPRGTNAEPFLEILLTLGGVPSTAVEVVDVAPDAQPDALAQGRVDAIAAWSPFRERAKRALGDDAVEISSKVYTEMSMLVARTEALQRRRDAIRKLLRGLVRAERLVQERPDEALAVLQRRTPSLPADELRAQWDEIDFMLGLQNQLVVTLEREAEIVRSRLGLGAPLPDFGALLAPELLEETLPEAVTVRRDAERGRGP
jgi:NitT/TauT family transport system substrate-binding protein